ncbi:MAG: phosphoserine phosphatase SerB [Candidatus Odinarchaeia archaeon]
MVPPIEFNPRALITFDFDSVLSPIEIIDELASLNNRSDEVKEITMLAMNGEIDYYNSLIKRVKLLKGLPVDELIKLGEKLPLTPGVEKVIQFIIKHNVLPVIISGGFYEVINIANQRIGAPIVIANRLKTKNGVLTGEVYGPCLTPESKGEILAYLVEKFKIPMKKTAAVCDGANDLNILRKVYIPLGFRPKEAILNSVKYKCFNDLREILGYLVTEDFFEL